jgi:DNA (cytosine-5)-methyltransferase 1
VNVGSLFSGIGGLDLGLERAGMRVLWQVERDPYARKVLARHWPSATIYDDVRTVGAASLAPVDLLCGGFPCQDISHAGKMAGIKGERSGLWSEYVRIIRELRPAYVIVENVAALLNRGMGRVVGDLAESGYDAEWDCFPASAFGAYHERDRLFIVAYPTGIDGASRNRVVQGDSWRPSLQSRRLRGVAMALATRAYPNTRFEDEPSMDRMVHGVPGGVDRIKCLGNAVVPAVAEWLGRRIIAHSIARSAAV